MGFKNLTLEHKTVDIGGGKFVLKKWRTALRAYLETKVLDGREFNPESGTFTFTGKTSEKETKDEMVLKVKGGLQKWHLIDEDDNPVPINDETITDLLDNYPDVASPLLDEILDFNKSVLRGGSKKKGK